MTALRTADGTLRTGAACDDAVADTYMPPHRTYLHSSSFRSPFAASDPRARGGLAWILPLHLRFDSAIRQHWVGPAGSRILDV